MTKVIGTPRVGRDTLARPVIQGTDSIRGGSTGPNVIELALENDQDAPGANKVYGTDSNGSRGWKNDPVAPEIELVTFTTELNFTADKDLETVLGGTTTFTLGSGNHLNGVGIVARINEPVAVNFPAGSEQVSGSDDIDTGSMNIIVFRYFENYDGAGNDKVLYIIKNQDAV